MFIEHMLHARCHGWNLTNVIYLIRNITQEVVTTSLILQMKLCLTPDRWAVKRTGQDSTRSRLALPAALHLLRAVRLILVCEHHSNHKIAKASLPISAALLKVEEVEHQPWIFFGGPVTLKNELMKARS